MKRIIAFTLAMFAFMGFRSCGSKYNSSYSAVGYVHSNTANNAYMSFSEFTGTEVFILECSASDIIKYSAKLETGSATVYYDPVDDVDEKTVLCEVKAGDDIQLWGGELTDGHVYIIIETDGKCEEGSLTFEIVHLG